jgi:hypothetical protein
VQIAFSTKVDAFAQSKLAARAEGIRTRPKRAAHTATLTERFLFHPRRKR